MNNLVRMVYVSTSANPIPTSSGAIPNEVGRILMQSRKNNPARKVGGVLYFSNNYFLQCLEGEQQEVDHLYRKISADSRHTHVQSISVKHVENRLFSNWSMKYVALDKQVNKVLQQYQISEFNPYKFNEEMIETLLALFVQADDAIVDSRNIASDDDKPPRKGFLSWLFNRRKAA